MVAVGWLAWRAVAAGSELVARLPGACEVDGDSFQCLRRTCAQTRLYLRTKHELQNTLYM